MVVMSSDGPSPLLSFLRRAIATIENATMPGPCWSPHFMIRERRLFSNPTLSKPHLFPRRDGEQRHAVGSYFALGLCFYLAACNLSSRCLAFYS